MHKKGYVHRDLKLDNILIDPQTKNIKIIDFGFSLKSGPGEKLNVYCGTPHYMDPDLARKAPYSGMAADIWACGIILYIILVGKLPFFAEFEADLFRKIQSGKYTALPADVCSSKVRGLLNAIFQVDTSRRFTAEQVRLLGILTQHLLDIEPPMANRRAKKVEFLRYKRRLINNINSNKSTLITF